MKENRLSTSLATHDLLPIQLVSIQRHFLSVRNSYQFETLFSSRLCPTKTTQQPKEMSHDCVVDAVNKK